MTTRRALAFSYLDRYASLVLSIGSSMIIARLLTPADIGVFSVTMVLLSYAATVRDMGAGGYLVQERELTTDRIRAVWAVQLALGVGLGLMVALLSAPVAWFYEEPRMLPVMLVLAANYAINPFGSLTYAWQMREMQFDKLALIRFLSTLVGSLMSVLLAWHGWGPLSLALGALGSTLCNAALAVYFRPSHFPWMPGLKEVRRVLGFGGRTTGASMLQTVSTSGPEILLGKLQGMTATGLFSRATGLIGMFDRLVLQAISSVAIPWFAQQSRDDKDLPQAFLRATSYVTAVGWAFSACLALLAFPAIRVLYGDQWDASVGLTRILCTSLALTVPAAMCLVLLLAVGAAGQVLRATWLSTVWSLPLLLGGAWMGSKELAAALAIAALIRTVVWLHVTRKQIEFSWAELASRLSQSACVALAAAVGPFISVLLFGLDGNVWGLLLMGVPTALVGFLLALLLLKHPLASELGFLQIRVAKQPSP